MRELDPMERKERRGEGKEGREEEENGDGRNFAFERTGENYGGELRCNIGPARDMGVRGASQAKRGGRQAAV